MVPNQILTTSVTIPTVSPHIGKPVPLLINLPLTQNSNKPPLFSSQKFPFLRFLGILWGKTRHLKTLIFLKAAGILYVWYVGVPRWLMTDLAFPHIMLRCNLFSLSFFIKIEKLSSLSCLITFNSH